MDNTMEINYKFHVFILLLAINAITGFSAPYIIAPQDISMTSKTTLDNYNAIMSNPNSIWGSIARIDIKKLAIVDTLLFFLR